MYLPFLGRVPKDHRVGSNTFTLGTVGSSTLVHIVDNSESATLCGEIEFRRRGKPVTDPRDLLPEKASSGAMGSIVVCDCAKCLHNATLWREPGPVLGTVDV